MDNCGLSVGLQTFCLNKVMATASGHIHTSMFPAAFRYGDRLSVSAHPAIWLSSESFNRLQYIKYKEPESWAVENGNLTMDVTPQSDYWRISHYGFTVDDAPFIYTTRGGEFSDFKITHLPDQRRLEWLKNNQAE